jgi:hypothetical protein
MGTRIPTLPNKTLYMAQEMAEPPKIGDLAIIADENNPRNNWPFGRVSKIYRSKDGQIRVVDISTTYRTFKRPLTKVAVLS